MGVKLVAWVGGFALFLGVVFAVKYSFEHDLIPPEVRVALGFLIGIGLVAGGVLMSRKQYAVTAQTLCGTGTLILYASSFAAKSYYHLISNPVAFCLMVLITAAAFLLAVRLDALVVAVLGLVGGFLTPPLLSTGVDNPGGLFGYIALLDAGLIAVALHRRWDFLTLLGAIGTVLMQIGWATEFFQVEKVFVAMAIFLSFDALFLLAFWLGTRLKRDSAWLSASAVGVPFVSLAFTFFLLTYHDLGVRPGVLFTFVGGADLCLLMLALLDARLRPVHVAAGLMAFLFLSAWTVGHLTNDLLNWALAGYLVFAVLHSIFPIALRELRSDAAQVWWGHLFPPLALLLVMVPIFKLTDETSVSLLVWPLILLLDVLAVGLAVLSASLVSIFAVLFLTIVATAIWVLRLPAALTGLPEMLAVIGGFAVFFFVVGVFAGRKIVAKLESAATAPGTKSSYGFPFALAGQPTAWLGQVPAFSAILPFLLLIMVVARLPLTNPSPVFGLALLLVGLLLGVTRAFRMDWLPAVGLASVLALEKVWHEVHFRPQEAGVPLVWYLAFYAVFAAFPFVFRAAMEGRVIPWAVSALSGPLHFYLVHRLFKVAYPNHYMGLLPAVFAVPSLVGLMILVRTLRLEAPRRTMQLAWFGGVALFFITLIFPIQFDKQWITIGWALEGAALLWLFHRVPHAGLRLTGVGLLVVAFVRLANPAVLSYQERSATPILNWYLYTYGIVTVCLFLSARLLAPPRNLVMQANVPPVLCGLGTVLAFLLLNIEIADKFTAVGATALTFEFSGNFARDMTYSIAWALFALVLLVVGIAKRQPPVRYAGLGLLGITLVKLFFHDLGQLKDLYKIGAFIGVAIIAILASFLYQRFLSPTLTRHELEATDQKPRAQPEA